MHEISEMRGSPARGRAAIELTEPRDPLPPAAPIHEMPGASRRGEVTNVAMSTEQRLSPTAPTQEIAGPKADEGEEDHSGHDAHIRVVDLADPVHQIADREAGEGEVGHSSPAPHGRNADLANLIAELREQWRRRQAWHRAEKALTLQAKALCRRLVEGDRKEADRLYGAALGKGEHPLAEIALAAIFPLTEARSGVERHRRAVEKRLVVLAKGLPVAPWVEATRGVGLLSLAAIVGEAGDLESYANPAKLWKRLGLAVMPDGTRQRRVGGADALDHGYSPARRSVVWNIGSCIVKAGGPLKEIYDARKVYEAERVETKAHAHNRAQRYVEKRFLRLLWSEWRKGGGDQPRGGAQTIIVAPAA